MHMCKRSLPRRLTPGLHQSISTTFGFQLCWVLPVGGERPRRLSLKLLPCRSLWIRSIPLSQPQIKFLRTTPSFCPFQLKMVMGPHGRQQGVTAPYLRPFP